MAFQINESEIHAILRRMVETYDSRGTKTTSEWIGSIEPDLTVRQKIQAVLTMSVRCEKEGRSPMNIRKLICWRDEKGEPSKLEAEWKDR